MLNVTISKLNLWKLEKNGYWFDFKEKMTTLRSINNESLFELIYDVEKNQIIVLTKEKVYHASEVEINVNEKEEIVLNLNLDNAKIKQLSLNGENKPVLYCTGEKATITMIAEH